MLGTSIGNYTVTAKIGEGGQGTVYLAEHPMLGRRAAVKVLLPQLSNQRDVVARFFNEARAATAIHHPSIVEIFDFGYLPDASAYIVMEFLAGETLAARCRRLGRLEPVRALALVRQIAGALAAAHDCSIVHRDLKPDNVFIVPDPEVPGGERIKILDFGIAKLAPEAGEASHTQTGTVLGTPTYIAPEQCRATGRVDGRADLYALGGVFYELVTGRPPFIVDGAGEMIAHHLYFEPQPPRTHMPGLPEPVDRLILWLLRKDPAARPQSARALIDAIDRIDLSGLGAGPGQPAPGQAPRAAHSSTTLPAHSTTLSSAAGASLRAPPSRARRRWLTAGVAITTVAAGIAVYLAASAGPSANSAASSAAKVEEPRPVYVQLTLESDPSGAVVLVDGKQVGTTPLTERVVAGSPGRVYTIRRNGYEDVTAALDTARDGSRRVSLHKLPPPVQTPSPASLGDKGINPFDH